MKKETIILALLIINTLGIFVLVLQQKSSVCVLETCHGLDIQCGPYLPGECTAVYHIGDKCLQYARCRIRDGQCQQVEIPEFTQCKSCVQACLNVYNESTALLECESKC